MIRPLRIAVVAIAAAVASPFLFVIYLNARSGGAKVFEPQGFDYALLVVGILGIIGGMQVVPWRRAGYVGVLALLASASLLFGVLAAFSIGLAFLPVALVLLVLLFRRLRRSSLAMGRPAALGGSVIGYALVLLYLALIIPATVECFPNGAGTSSGRWRGSPAIQMSSGGMSADSRTVTGRIESTDSIATFRCVDGRVVEFRREPR